MVDQTIDLLRAEIVRGAWIDTLPGERVLAAGLLVGRNTLRAALRDLVAEGVVKPRRGVGYRILRVPRAVVIDEKKRGVGLLIPGGLRSLRASQILWIDQLRALLAGHEQELCVHHRFPRDPGRYSCWVLMLCDGALQRRCARAGVPCVIAGSPHAGVDLPSVDIDHRAVCRHAVGAMLGRGHRDVAFVTRRPFYAGDHESEIGFFEGVRLSGREEVSARVVRHDDTRAGVIRVLRRLLRQPTPPTALLVGDSHHYATVFSWLASAGAHATASVSLVCRDDDPLLAHLVPEPARYAFSTDRYAREVLKLVREGGRVARSRTIRLLPRLIPGETLAKLVPK